MSRFVRPQTTTLALTRGDTITVKTRLTSGEQRDAFARMYIAGMDGRLRANPLQTGLAMMVAYLIDWSLTDDDGQPVPIKGLPIAELESVLNTLEPESFTEIKLAIERHEGAMAAARDVEKKTIPDGEPNAGAILASRSAADGVLTGSAI